MNGENFKDSDPRLPRIFPNEPLAATTEEDKKNWKGWCEIESEPVPQRIPQSDLWQGLLTPTRPFSISCSDALVSKV